MKKVVQKVMISSIYTAKNNGVMSDIWKFTSVFYFAMATSSYLVFLYLVVNNFILRGALSVLVLNLIPHNGYNVLFNMVLYFIAPIMAMDYWLIIRGDRYKKLVTKYPNQYNKKAFAWYFMLAIAVMYATLFLKVK